MLRLPIPNGRYTAVRLASDLPLSDAQRSFARDGDDWVLELEPAGRAAARVQARGRPSRRRDASTVCDPGNPQRAPGAFGEKSVLELPGYAAPAWLEAETVAGPLRRARDPRARARRARSAIRVWSPADVAARHAAAAAARQRRPGVRRARRRSRASRAAKIAAGELPPHRVALLAPGDRNQWYSRLGRLRARARRTTSCPRCATPSAWSARRPAMGASLGGLAMLHAQRRFPRAFGALFLQSG